jgi:polysaccharide export outer membrane protein
MTMTCKIRPLFFCSLILFVAGARGQSLEDKVSEAKLEALREQMRNQNPEALDSAMAEHKDMLKATTEKKSGKRKAGLGATANIMPDSLLAAPDSTDTLSSSDTTETGLRKGKLRKSNAPPPKRYEQRIFRNVDRTVFSSASGAAGRDYVLGPGDEISVSLWGEREKEYDLILNHDGKIFLEGAGVIKLAGSNLNEAQEMVKQHLGKVYSGITRGTAHVDVSLAKAGPIRVFVLGEVKLPGGYVFSGNSSILSALYFAQGPSDIGTVRNLQLSRNGKKYPLDLYSYLIHGEALSPNLLLDGDVLFAGRADALVEIAGDVGRPAIYELKKGEGIKELLEFAGRPNATAAEHKLTLQRIFPDGKIDYMDLASPKDYLAGKAKMELQDGDKVLVEKSTETGKNYYSISGPVKYPGNYEATGVRTVQQLVVKAGGLREDAFLGRVHVVHLNPDGSSTLRGISLDTALIDTIALQPTDYVILYSTKDMYLPDSVGIAGAVFNPGKYEFREGMTAKDLVMQAGGFLPHREKGRLVIFRSDTRQRTVDQIVINDEDGLRKVGPGFRLQPTDFVHVPVDSGWYIKQVVTLEGLFVHPGKYVLLYPGESLASVVQRAGGFKDNAYQEGGRFFRSRDGVGKIGVDVKRAVNSPGNKANISLVDGDSLYIPERLSTVKVIGEVGFETSVLYKSGSSVQYYIEKAGGFTRRSEKNRVVVQYANGETSRDGYFNRKPDAGSVIYVPQGPEPKPIEWFQGIQALLGTLGVAAAVILSIQAIKK